jgi:broad specificity phosphatase PhoE
MLAAMTDARESVDAGEVVIVSHQLPIWMAHRALAGEPLHHDPRKRRCSLSSITSFTWVDGRFLETDYQELSADVIAQSTDLGAV